MQLVDPQWPLKRKIIGGQKDVVLKAIHKLNSTRSVNLRVQLFLISYAALLHRYFYHSVNKQCWGSPNHLWGCSDAAIKCLELKIEIETVLSSPM